MEHNYSAEIAAQLARETRQKNALVKLGNRVANRVIHLWLRSHGADISHMRPEIAEEAISGLCVALAEQEIPLDSLVAENAVLPADVIRAAFRAAQSTLRKFARNDSFDTAWHEDMHLQDSPEKDMLTATFDAYELRQKRAAIIAKARRMVKAARAFARANPSQRAAQTLRTDLHGIARATRYMLACVLGDSEKPFDFRNVFAWSEETHSMYDAAQKRLRRTMARIEEGAELIEA